VHKNHATGGFATPKELIVIMMLELINIIQFNVNHCAAAQNLLTQTANADVVLVNDTLLVWVTQECYSMSQARRPINVQPAYR